MLLTDHDHNLIYTFLDPVGPYCSNTYFGNLEIYILILPGFRVISQVIAK